MDRGIVIAGALVLIGFGCGSTKENAGSSTPNTGGAAGGMPTMTPAANGPPSSIGTNMMNPVVGGDTSAGGKGSPSMTTNTGGGAAVTPTADDAGAMATDCPKCTIPANCQGFPLKGCKYSPGGTRCRTSARRSIRRLNNPYAVRCIDAMPEFKTKFPGDQYCILPPPPDQGHPGRAASAGQHETYWDAIWAGDYSGYDNPDDDLGAAARRRDHAELPHARRADDDGHELLPHVLPHAHRLASQHHHDARRHRSRTVGSQGVGDALPGLFDASSGAVIGILGGQQRADDSTPVTLETPPEDEGVYLTFPANPAIIFNMHHFNIPDGADPARRLVEHLVAETDATQLAAGTWASSRRRSIGLSVSPNQDGRLAIRLGHRRRHAAVARVRSPALLDHELQLVDRARRWRHRARVSVVRLVRHADVSLRQRGQEPELDPDAKTDGAMSGVVMLHAGDKHALQLPHRVHGRARGGRQARAEPGVRSARCASPTKLITAKCASSSATSRGLARVAWDR